MYLSVYSRIFLDIFFVHIFRYRVVNVKKCYCILTYNSSDELAKCSVNIYFTGYRNSLCCQTAVHITWYKSELCLECRPAFSGDCYIFAISFVFFYPVFNVSSYCASFGRISGFLFPAPSSSSISFTIARNSFISGMFVKCFKQIQLRVFFNFYVRYCKAV